MEAAGEAPLAHHETQRQHEESADSRHDVGDGHKSGLVRLRDVVAAVLQVDTMERAFYGGCAKLIMHYKQEDSIVDICVTQRVGYQIQYIIIPFHPLLTMAGANSKADAFLFSVEDHIEAFHDDSPHHCTSARLGNGKLIAVLLGGCHVLYWPQVLLRTQKCKITRKKHTPILKCNA